MSSQPDIEIRSYLLGTLSEADQQRIEERLFTVNGFLEELLADEDELIDDYVSNDLDADSRSRFEQHFLSTPERQRKLRFAFALSSYSSRAAVVVPTSLNWWERLKAFWSGQTLVFRYAAVVALFAFVAAFVWLSLPRTFTPKSFATITLSISSGDRAEGPTRIKVKLPQNAGALKIILKLPDMPLPARGYRVELINDKGTTESLEIAEQNAQTLAVVLTMSQLVRGDNAFRLYASKSDGGEERINGNYFFTVE